MNNTFIYTYNARAEEESLCALELRAFFVEEGSGGSLRSSISLDPGRSPFLKEKIEVLYESATWEALLEKLRAHPPLTASFKVQFVKNHALPTSFEDRKQREIAAAGMLDGKINLADPAHLFAIFPAQNSWVFGPLTCGSSAWKKQEQKPHSYSTALPVRVARSAANIAVPNPSGIYAIDPCCGIGTVVIEARSMGIQMDGSDVNPKVMYGLRKNLSHFGFAPDTALQDMRMIEKSYDAAVIDMPYNLCSVLPEETKLEMLQSARNFTQRLVIITIEPLDHLLKKAGFAIIDRGTAGKNKMFSREILVCE
ncbi:TRM11 family SAM-dependent methyltransferase [Alkalicoccus daliensis]|uniref:RNA methyltransferase n=1 Tax=Alkalicoccus daliensis TaxID=745820 RepID=A0A1H0JLX2_9BACI|nr:hypothetical protein [Alkalicoccus daliensis]SDO44429.1 hypothetical protein SAMN04488053_1147 [Alkalicoccus daliensis]